MPSLTTLLQNCLYDQAKLAEARNEAFWYCSFADVVFCVCQQASEILKCFQVVQVS